MGLQWVPHFSLLGNRLLHAEACIRLLDGRRQHMQDRHDMQDGVPHHITPLSKGPSQLQQEP